MSLNLKFIEKELEYDGAQLAPHWIYRNFDVLGDALVSFIGPCKVDLSHMVDLVDVKNKEDIFSPKMLHFIGEIFDTDLRLMILRQRLLIITIKEELEDRAVPGRIVRKGNDLYHIGIADVKRKLSVAVATKSINSTLMHTGVNINTQGTPVPTAGLFELGIEPAGFAKRIIDRFAVELEEMEKARCKVKSV